MSTPSTQAVKTQAPSMSAEQALAASPELQALIAALQAKAAAKTPAKREVWISDKGYLCVNCGANEITGKAAWNHTFSPNQFRQLQTLMAQAESVLKAAGK